MKKLGIDFGTSFCTMAAWNERNHTCVPIRDRNGDEKIPTIVFWDANGNHEIGEAAQNRLKDGGTDEERDELHLRTIIGVKRRLSQPIIPLPDGTSIKPADVVCKVLKYLKQDAEEFFFSRVDRRRPNHFSRRFQDVGEECSS